MEALPQMVGLFCYGKFIIGWLIPHTWLHCNENKFHLEHEYIPEKYQPVCIFDKLHIQGLDEAPQTHKQELYYFYETPNDTNCKV